MIDETLPRGRVLPDPIHSCSYYCDPPECIKQQRDELREQLERVTAERDELRRRIRDAQRMTTDGAWTARPAWLKSGKYALVRLKDDEL